MIIFDRNMLFGNFYITLSINKPTNNVYNMAITNSYEVIIQNTHSGALPQALRFKRFLFNEPKHIMSQDCDEIHHFYLLNKTNDCVDAQFNLFVKEQSGISPAKAPFGSIKFFHGLEREVLCNFIQQILAFAQQLNLVSIQITSYPDCYEPQQANLLRECLIAEGFDIVYAEINQHVPVSKQPFDTRLHLSAQRRLKKCKKADFIFEEVKKPDFEEIHQLIVMARQRKNFPISLKLDELKKLFEDFPEEFKLFAVKDQETVIAACIGVIVRESEQDNKGILYYFMPADHSDYLTSSPTTMLVDGLYQYCQQNGFVLLDLGISTSKGIPNEGLIRFKHNLGAVDSHKFSFCKRLV